MAVEFQLQMQAGVFGWNAIRVYNPTKQLIDLDSECRFVKQWVPEVRDVLTERIIKGESIPSYPAPVVPFNERAKWMTNLLYSNRNSAEAKAAATAVYLKHRSRRKERVPRRKRPPRNVPPKKTQTRSLFDELPEE